MTAEDGDLREFKDARIAGKTTDIVMTALDKGHLRSLLADLLSQSEARVRELAAEIHAKTDGVPSHVLELLFELHDQNALFYDALHNQWTWDLEQVRAHFFSDNTRERIERQLEKLPPETLGGDGDRRVHRRQLRCGARCGRIRRSTRQVDRRAPAQSRWRRSDRRTARGSGTRHALPVRASARARADLPSASTTTRKLHIHLDSRGRADTCRRDRHIGKADRRPVQRGGRPVRRGRVAPQRDCALQPARRARSARRQAAFSPRSNTAAAVSRCSR